MIKNYLTIALRNLTRQPGYTVINVLVHQALNPDPHKLVLFLLLGVGKILPDDECRDINALCLGITPVFPPSCLPKPRRRLGSEENNFVYGVHYLMLGTLGLAVGLACFMIIMMYVVDEMS